MITSVLASSYANLEYFIDYRKCYYLYSAPEKSNKYYEITFCTKLGLFVVNMLFISSRVIFLVILAILNYQVLIVVTLVHLFYHFLFNLLDINSVKLILDNKNDTKQRSKHHLIVRLFPRSDEVEQVTTKFEQANKKKYYQVLRGLFRVGYTIKNFFVFELFGQSVLSFLRYYLVALVENLIVILVLALNYNSFGENSVNFVYAYFLAYALVANVIGVLLQLRIYDFDEEK